MKNHAITATKKTALCAVSCQPGAFIHQDI